MIEATYTDRMRVIRTVYVGTNEKTEVIYDDMPCGLARSAYTHSPTPVGFDNMTVRQNYRLRLYASPDVIFHLGDRVEVTRGSSVYIGTASDSFTYDSHSVCVLEVEEVRAI